MYILYTCPDPNRQLAPADRITCTDELQLGAADYGDMGSGIACESTDEAYEAYEDGDSYIVDISCADELQLGAADYGDMGSGIACESTDEAYEDGDSYIIGISSPNIPTSANTSSAHTAGVGDLTGDSVDKIASDVFNVEPLAFEGVYVYCAVISIHKY